jgi:hypothetical protein
MIRIYAKGRPTTGWRKDERITSPQQVKPGNVLIGVNHQFEAENLYVVIPSPHPPSPHDDEGFYVRNAQPDLTLTPTDFQPQWIWGFQLSQDEWFKSIPSQ